MVSPTDVQGLAKAASSCQTSTKCRPTRTTALRRRVRDRQTDATPNASTATSSATLQTSVSRPRRTARCAAARGVWPRPAGRSVVPVAKSMTGATARPCASWPSSASVGRSPGISTSVRVEQPAQVLHVFANIERTRPINTSPLHEEASSFLAVSDDDRRTDTDERTCLSLLMSYPLPLIDGLLDNFEAVMWFLSLPMASGFWAVSMTERAKLISAFIYHLGHFQWVRMPFGLKNAPLICQRTINNLLWGLVQPLPWLEKDVDAEVLEFFGIDPLNLASSQVAAAMIVRRRARASTWTTEVRASWYRSAQRALKSRRCST
ncbi:hypothetical protein PybrP1_000402 [[Pythium] brassicae (nom. inval.)]|nr:hypothetical protein PybrP1_000402 [[Pythium] brassicae (nom. inval.)]